MPEWLVAVICFAIVIVSIIISSVIKFVMKKVKESSGEILDCKKWEYLFAGLSLVISAVGVFCFLKFFAKIDDISELIKYTVLYAGSVQSVYLFIVQLVRKGGNGIIEIIIRITKKIRGSENPLSELPEIINSETDEQESDKDVKKVTNEFQKILTKK